MRGRQILYHYPRAKFWQCLNSCWEERLPWGLWPLEWAWLRRPGAAPVRLQVCVNSRSGFPVRLCSETRSRLDALAVFLILDRDSLSAVRNEWNFLKLFFFKYILPIECGASTASVLQNGGLEVNPSGHHDDGKARGFDLNGHSSRSPLNRVLHGAGQLRLLKTTKCSF